MDYFDLQKVFNIPKLTMALFGYWPTRKTSNLLKTCCTLTLTLQTVFICVTAMQVYHSIGDNIEVALEVTTILIPPLSYLIKHLYFILNKKEFLDLYGFLEDGTLASIPRQLHPLMQKPLRLAKVVGVTYQVNCAVTVLLYNTIPLVTEKTLPVHFSLFELGRLHFAMYLLQFFGICHAAANNSALDFLAYNFMGVVNGQARVLNEKIRSFGGLNCADSEGDLIRYLNGCVFHHNKIIMLIQKVEKVFSMILLVQYLTSIVVICNIGFQLVIVKIFSLQFFLMFSFFIAMMCQLGLYCWFGNEIILNSSDVRTACYESDWVNSTVRVRKILIIIMERGKRPLYLTAGKFSILSLSSFTSVINSAYSFFALMQRMYRQSADD